MAYNDDSVKAKLSALNESQESIVTVAQWIMFHRRYADRTAQLWLQRLRESPYPKRLNLIYLANEVVQQSKARKKEEFANAFSPIIADATTAAYKGASLDTQQKIRRVVEVWRARGVFAVPIQEAIEARLEELDKARGTVKKPLGGSLSFATSESAVPAELRDVAKTLEAVNKAAAAAKPTVDNMETEYAKLVDPNAPVPTPPVLAARLASLLKSLASSETAVAQGLNQRKSLITGLEKLLNTQRAQLEREEVQHSEFQRRKSEAEAKKRDVEDAIMKGLSAEEFAATNGPSNGTADATTPEGEPLRPEREALTPQYEALTPGDTPPPERGTGLVTTTGADIIEELPRNHNEPPPDPSWANAEHMISGVGALADTARTPARLPSAPEVGADLLASLSAPHGGRAISHSPPVNGTGGMSAKKRKLQHTTDDDLFGKAGVMDDLDADVAQMLERQ